MKIILSIFLFCTSLFAAPLFTSKICDSKGNELLLVITKIQMSERGAFNIYKKNQVTSDFDQIFSWGFLEEMKVFTNPISIQAKVTEMRSKGLSDPYYNDEVKTVLYPESAGNGMVFNPMSQGISSRVQLSHYYSTQYCK